MTFREEWYPPADLAALASAARRATASGAIVEFGSWEGRSAITIARAVAPRILTCVDPWDGSGGEQYRRAAEAHAAFQRNTRGEPNITALTMTWQEYLERPRTIAFAHIDAEHTYEATRGAIRRLLPLVAPGGVVCGHDYDPRPAMAGGWPGVVRAVDEMLPHRRVEGTVWSWTAPAVRVA